MVRGLYSLMIFIVTQNLFYTANSVVFPELELSCSAAYDREEEKYVLDSQLTAPFSPATLSNIEVFVIRWDSFLKPQPGVRDPTAIALGLFRRNIPVSFTNTFFNLSIILLLTFIGKCEPDSVSFLATVGAI